MQQSRNLIPRQAKKSKNLMPLCHCATVPLRHCVMSVQLNNFFLKFLKKIGERVVSYHYFPYLCIVIFERFKRDVSTMQRPRLEGAKI